MSFKESFRELEDALDLTKRFPGYFDKRIFRFFLLVFVVLFLLTLHSNGWALVNTWALCDSTVECRNPFVLCDVLDVGYDYSKLEGVSCLREVNWRTRGLCEAGVCDREFLLPGEVVGNPPSVLVVLLKINTFILFLIAVIINHFAYLRRRRKEALSDEAFKD